MRLADVLSAADKQGIDTLTGDFLAAIWAIESCGQIDRRDTDALTAHNRGVLAAHETLNVWRQRSPTKATALLKELAIIVEPTSKSFSPRAVKIIPGAEGHTHPIVPTDGGTGLINQKKSPRYDKDGHAV